MPPPRLVAVRLREPEVPNSDARLVEDHLAIAEIRSELASVHSQLAQINSAIIAIQTHSLRQTGGVALTLSVLMVIAWKVIGG